MGIDFEIVVSSDFMAADLSLRSSSSAAERQSGALIEELLRLGLPFGHELDLIARIEAQWHDPEFWFQGPIASGRFAEPGHPGFLITAFCPFLLTGEHDAFDRIDFNERHRLIAARKGEILGRRYPARNGTGGCDLRGKQVAELPQPDDSTTLGSGASLDDQGFIRATRDGVVVHQHSKSLDVVDIYEHVGNVGAHTGNLRSTGSLVIKGDVQPGLKVEVDGDLVVLGTIDQAHFRSGGHTEVTRAIIGGPEIQGRSAGDLSCQRLLAANLSVAGSLRFDRELVNSRIRARSVGSDNPRATIVGSDIKATEKIRCACAGSPAAATLSLAVGVDWALQDRIRRLESTQTSRGKGRRGTETSRGRSARRNSGVEEKLATLKLQMRRKHQELVARAAIEITKIIHAGTSIAIGNVHETIDFDCGPTRFVLDPVTGALAREKLKR